MKTSVVIPNWQGKHLLEKNLPKVLAIGADEVIIVENGSTDGSLELIQNLKVKNQSYNSKLKIIENKTNLGFARAVNQGFEAAIGDIVILLNTDVIPEKDLLKHVLPHFNNPQVFGVSFNESVWSWARGHFEKGLVEHEPGPKTQETHASLWASGGNAAINRRKWLELGGFNLIYEPFYWEDTDISYRAQKKSWEVLWEPKAKVEHKHEETVRKHSQGTKKDLISQRNQLLFFWCNITSFSIWMSHLLWLPIRLLRPGFWRPFLWALSKTPQVIYTRLKNGGSKVSDEEIFNKFKS